MAFRCGTRDSERTRQEDVFDGIILGSVLFVCETVLRLVYVILLGERKGGTKARRN